MKQQRPLSIMLCVALAVDVVLAVWLCGWQLRMHAIAGVTTDGDELLRPEMRVGNLSGSLRGMTLVTGVVFLLWFQQARDWAERRQPERRARGGASWSLVWFFIPLVNFVKPFFICVDVWRASRPAGRPRFRASTALGAWWLLLMTALRQLWQADEEFDATRVWPRGTAAELTSALESGMLAGGLYIAVAAATAAFAWNLTRMQTTAPPYTPRFAAPTPAPGDTKQPAAAL